MIVGAALTAVDLLRSNYLGGNTVCVHALMLAVAGLNELGVDAEVLQVLSFVVEVPFEAFEQGRQEAFRQPLDHVIGVDNEDGAWSIAQIADMLLLVCLERVFISFLLTQPWLRKHRDAAVILGKIVCNSIDIDSMFLALQIFSGFVLWRRGVTIFS